MSAPELVRLTIDGVSVEVNEGSVASMTGTLARLRMSTR
jgi:hypothetical protein